MQGIYKIVTLHNKKYYVGSSIDIFKRWRDHRSKLAMHKHANKYLQNVYNKYGIEDFEFLVLKEMPQASQRQIREAEQEILDEIFCNDKDNIYNLAPQANGGNSTKFSEKALQSISDKNKKYDEEIIQQIKEMLDKGWNQNKIAIQLDINKNVICQLIKKYLPQYTLLYQRRIQMRKMFELEQQGVNRKTIANKMGISPSKVSSYLNNFSYYYLGKPRTLTEEELEKIKQYIQLGYGNVKIGQILGHGHTTIQNWRRWLEELKGDKWWEQHSNVIPT